MNLYLVTNDNEAKEYEKYGTSVQTLHMLLVREGPALNLAYSFLVEALEAIETDIHAAVQMIECSLWMLRRHKGEDG